jgi:hypothetical protein
MSNVAHLDEARRILRHLDDDHRFAVYLALHEYEQVERYDDDMVRLFPVVAPRPAIATRQAPVAPARRRPGWLEAIRGVECCDPAVRDQWRVWRVCFLVIGIIVMVAVSAAVVFGSVGLGVVLFLVFVASAAASHRITGGKASVCH